MFGKDDRHTKNLEHAANPKIGDYWHEMFVPICVVVDVSETSITVCDQTKSVGDRKWTWDIDKLNAYTKKQFWNRYRYGRVSNESFEATDEDTIKNKFWCDVEPEAHAWVSKAICANTVRAANSASD